MKIGLGAAVLIVPALSWGTYLGYLYPAGGRAGTTVEVIFGGQRIGNAKTVLATHPGITVESIETVPGLPRPEWRQRRYLEKWLRNIAAGNRAAPPRPGTEITREWRKCRYWDRLPDLTPPQRALVMRDLFEPPNALQENPALKQLVMARLRIAPGVPPGEYELRLPAAGAISNPMKFQVSPVPETAEPLYMLPPAKPEIPFFTAPGVLNGQIFPGETDRFRFSAKAGEIFRFRLYGRHFKPFIGDAVPGHFQPVLGIVDSAGRTAAFADDWGFDPDPKLVFTAPADGVYTLEIRDAIYRGRADFVYRVAVETGPAPREPAADSERRRTLRIPDEVRGALDVPGQPAVYTFEGTAGQSLCIELYARRDGESRLDGKLALTAPDGKLLAVSDDVKRLRIGPNLQDFDPTLMATLPQTGRYRLTVSDTTGAGSEFHTYRLKIAAPAPRFRVWCQPSSLDCPLLHGGAPLQIQVERLDGYAGPVELKLHAQNFRLVGTTVIPAGVDAATVTIQRKIWRGPQWEKVRLTAAPGMGMAGKTVDVTPADAAMQAFAYTHWIPCTELYLNRRWTPAGADRIDWRDGAKPVRWSHGDAELPLELKPLAAGASIEFELIDSPPGVTLETAPLRLRAAAPVSFNLILQATYRYPGKIGKDGKTTMQRSVFTLPARSVERHDSGKTAL